VAILALGIGANTAVFSVVDAVLLKPLPFPDSDRLVTVLEASPSKSEPESLIAPGRLARLEPHEPHLRRHRRQLQRERHRHQRRPSPSGWRAGAFRPATSASLGTASVRPHLHARRRLAGGPNSAVIGYAFWTRRYHQSPGAIGRRLIIQGKGYTIVGVMPKDFQTANIDVWIPAQTPPFLMRIREARFYSGVGA
jgi:putative ABC transport system permease protein